MARVKLQLPDTFKFHVDLRVRISDINYGNHLGNDAVLRLIHEARMRFFDQLGYGELDIEGIGLVIADAVIMYRSQAFYADLLTVAITVDDFSRNGCDFYYKLTNKNTGKEVARAKTGIVFFDYDQNKIARVPTAFRRKVEEYNQASPDSE